MEELKKLIKGRSASRRYDKRITAETAKIVTEQDVDKLKTNREILRQESESLRWERERERVDHILEDLCKEQGFRYIDNSYIDPTRHLNASELHLNKSGDFILADNLFKGSRQ